MNKPDEDFDDEDVYEDDDGMNKQDEDFDDDDEYEDGQGHNGIAEGDRGKTIGRTTAMFTARQTERTRMMKAGRRRPSRLLQRRRR